MDMQPLSRFTLLMELAETAKLLVKEFIQSPQVKQINIYFNPKTTQTMKKSTRINELEEALKTLISQCRFIRKLSATCDILETTVLKKTK